MISLKSLIPEIKIQPNKLEPKLDQAYKIDAKWLFNVEGGYRKYQVIQIDNDSVLLRGLSHQSKIFLSYNHFIEGLKTKNIIEI